MVLPAGSINRLKKKKKKTYTACPSYSALRGVTEPAEPVGASSIVITVTVDFPFPDFTSFIMLESFVPDQEIIQRAEEEM